MISTKEEYRILSGWCKLQAFKVRGWNISQVLHMFQSLLI